MESTSISVLQQEAEQWPGILSRFQLVILAGLRSKQLLRGAKPRIALDPLKKRNTSIALEELRRGLIPFQGRNAEQGESSARLGAGTGKGVTAGLV